MKRLVPTHVAVLLAALVAALTVSVAAPSSAGHERAGSGTAARPGPHGQHGRHRQQGQQGQHGQHGKGRFQRPNVVLVMTDDMATSDLAHMPTLRALVYRQGVDFDRAISPDPLCCPARASVITGQLPHNSGVKSNHGHYSWPAMDNRHTLPVWMQRAGYRTGFVGKYLHHFPKSRHEPGWTWWDPTISGIYSYYRYTMFQNGHPRRYRNLYNPDYVTGRTVSLIHRWSGRTPFFIWASQVAPHGTVTPDQEIATTEATPARRDRHRFAHAQLPTFGSPGYEETDLRDKNSWLNRPNKTVPFPRAKANRLFRSRIRALQPVDRGLRQIVKALKVTGELRSTYLVFVSDNGMLQGEHGEFTKNLPYAESLAIPMAMRGPGIHRRVSHEPATLADLSATITAIGHARPQHALDGSSLLPVAKGRRHLSGTELIEAGFNEKRPHPGTPWWWRGVSAGPYTYVAFHPQDFEELYDHRIDPGETQNLARFRRYQPVVAELRRRTQLLGHCRGRSCHRDFGPLPQPGPVPTG